MAKKVKTARQSKAAQPPAKSWQARIGAATDALAEQFVESLSFDHRLARHDITGSIAHATMLHHVGLLTARDLAAIRKGLQSILADIEADKFEFDIATEDIHMAVEAALIERIGEPGRKLHTARSRNDQVALDIRLWCVEASATLIGKVEDLQRAFVWLAQTQGTIPMPSYTHLQRAQPIVAGHELLAYAEMLERDKGRLRDGLARIKVCPLGAGAIAGTTLPIERHATAALLGFPAITANSLDSISDRDFLCELAFDLAMIAMHLSRWAEQWILYVTTEFGFIRLADQYTTGSSMMPQKRNPDMLELIRGKTGGVYGQLVALLTMMKGQPLAYNRDMQEDKRHIFQAYDQVEASLTIAAAMVLTATLQPERIAAHLDEGFSDATVLAEYMVQRGVPFRTAHQIVGALVRQCEDEGLEALGRLSLDAMKEQCPAIGPDVYEYLTARHVLERYRSHGAGGYASLKTQLARWKKLLPSAKA